MSQSEPVIRNMRRAELDVLVDWAANEGWNPGLADAGIFWDTDPEGFVAAELDGELVGGGSIVSYGGTYGFMGFFIVHDNPVIAEDLFQALSARVPGEAIFIDVPENNRAAVAMAGRHDMQVVFGCAKMYFGAKPKLPEDEIFAVTTFELG